MTAALPRTGRSSNKATDAAAKARLNWTGYEWRRTALSRSIGEGTKAHDINRSNCSRGREFYRWMIERCHLVGFATLDVSGEAALKHWRLK